MISFGSLCHLFYSSVSALLCSPSEIPRACAPKLRLCFAQSLLRSFTGYLYNLRYARTDVLGQTAASPNSPPQDTWGEVQNQDGLPRRRCRGWPSPIASLLDGARRCRPARELCWQVLSCPPCLCHWCFLCFGWSPAFLGAGSALCTWAMSGSSSLSRLACLLCLFVQGEQEFFLQ